MRITKDSHYYYTNHDELGAGTTPQIRIILTKMPTTFDHSLISDNCPD